MTWKYREQGSFHDGGEVPLSETDKVALLREVRGKVEMGFGLDEAVGEAVPVRRAAAIERGNHREIGRVHVVRAVLREALAGQKAERLAGAACGRRRRWSPGPEAMAERLALVEAAIEGCGEKARSSAAADPETEAGWQTLEAVRRRVVAGPGAGPGRGMLRWRADVRHAGAVM